MKVNKRDLGMFTGGAVIGMVIGGVGVIYKAITSDTFGPAIGKAIAGKIVDSIVDKPTYREYRKPERVSYYDREVKHNRESETDAHIN